MSAAQASPAAPRNGPAERPSPGRLLLVDPSDRGGIASHTDLVCRALREAGGLAELLANPALEGPPREYPVWPWLASRRWGDAAGGGATFHARRVAEWARSAAAVEAAARLRHPALIDFHSPLNRRFDLRLVRRLRRLAPVVWTAHEVLPFERTEADAPRFAAIYREVDMVVVHSPRAAERLHGLAGVEATVLPLTPPSHLERTEAAAARRRLGLPEQGRIVGALGFIRGYKGYELLAEVWERLGERAPLLLVMGELVEPAQAGVVERLRRTGRAELRVGYQSDEGLRLGFCASDAVALPYVEASESGLLDMARMLEVPVLASDAPQLAAAVREAEAGAVLPRSVEAWSQAVTAPLPAPPAPAGGTDAGRTRLAAYRRAREGWLERQGRPARPPARRPPALLAYTDAVELAGAEHSLATLLAGLGWDGEVTVAGVERRVVEALVAARPGARGLVLPPVRDKRDVRPIIAHVRALRRLRPDIFHANLRIPWACQYGLAAALCARGTRVIAVEQLITPASSRLQRALKRLTSLALDRHVAVGERLARGIEREVGLPAGAIEAIHNSVDTAPAADGARPARNAGVPVVGALARLAPEKSLDVLVSAMPELPGDAEVVLVGDGPERGRLEELGRDLGVGERLRIEGWVDDAPARLPAFDVFVLPSRFEGFPHAVLEAMVAGVPVVASDVGSVGEAVIDGETGLLVQPGDPAALAAAVNRLLADRELGERLAQSARRLVAERFGRRAMVEAYEKLYAEVLS